MSPVESSQEGPARLQILWGVQLFVQGVVHRNRLRRSGLESIEYGGAGHIYEIPANQYVGTHGERALPCKN